MSEMTAHQRAAQQRNERTRQRLNKRKREDRDLRASIIRQVRENNVCLASAGCKAGGYAGLPFCKEHAYRAAAKLRNEAEYEKAQEVIRAEREEMRSQYRDDFYDQRVEEQEALRFKHRNRVLPDGADGVVYYLRVGDLVKIGWTADLTERLKAYPPHSVLLAVQPGTLETEKAMHNKFAAKLAQGREWFKPCAEINAHVAELVAEHGDPTRRKAPAPRMPTRRIA